MFLLAFAEDVEFRILPVPVEEDPDWAAGVGENAVLWVLGEDQLFGFWRDCPCKVVVLTKPEEGRTPVDVE